MALTNYAICSVIEKLTDPPLDQSIQMGYCGELATPTVVGGFQCQSLPQCLQWMGEMTLNI